MASPIYRFGAFRLDPQARELTENGARVNLRISTIDCLIHLVRHRDRPVGRDELAAAVWGRVDVSEVSLTHAIMSLRRTLGDTGNEQRVIRTVPRLGYRWVFDDTVEESIDAAPAAPAVVAPPVAPVHPAAPPRRSRMPWIAVAVLAAAAVVLFVVRREPAPAPDAPPARVAMVLPATLDAPADAAWLRLGLMDLVANRLRRGDVATAPSETVVALVNARNGAAPDVAQAGLLVRPSVSYAPPTWTVRLEAQSAQRRLIVEARSPDAVAAGRHAADELLIKLGRKPPPDTAGTGASPELDTLRQRANAALLAGQVDLAQQLIDDAAPALKTQAPIAMLRAQAEFFAGRYDDSRRMFETLLERLPAGDAPDLRARALNSLGAAYFRLGRVDDAAVVYAQAAQLTDNGGDVQSRAKAYAGLGAVASQRLELDLAATWFGRARTLFDLANDMNGVASIDFNLGLNAMQRGQPAAALTMLRGVGARFAELGFQDALIAAKVATIDAELATLDLAAALATSDGFAALATQANARQRGELDIARAAALAANGRLRDADALVARVLDASDPGEQAMLRARAQALAATLALARGESATAAALAQAALIAPLERNLRPDYLAAWLTRLRALRSGGLVADAGTELARLVAWSRVDAKESDRVAVALAQAEQAQAEHRTDAALAHYADALAAAAQRGVPEDLVAVGYSAVPAQLAAGRTDEAAAISGRLAPWADRDARAAWVAAGVYAALGQTQAAQAARERAQRLAGERTLPSLGAKPPQ